MKKKKTKRIKRFFNDFSFARYITIPATQVQMKSPDKTLPRITRFWLSAPEEVFGKMKYNQTKKMTIQKEEKYLKLLPVKKTRREDLIEVILLK